MAQMVKNLPAMWDTWVRSLSWEDALEKEMATYSSILAWRIPWTEGPNRLQSMGLQRVGHDRAADTIAFTLDWDQSESLLSVPVACLPVEGLEGIPQEAPVLLLPKVEPAVWNPLP